MNKKSKALTEFLSMCPGVGHMYLGDMKKGITIMAIFFGMIYMTAINMADGIMAFSPLIWFYSIFDALKLVNNINGTYKKEKGLAVLFSFVPGVGHMYLGLMKKGLLIMAIFFGMIYMTAINMADAIMIFSPLIWFYGIFDALNSYNKNSETGCLQSYNNANNNFNENYNRNYNSTINNNCYNDANLNNNHVNMIQENNNGQPVDFSNMNGKGKILLKKKINRHI